MKYSILIFFFSLRVIAASAQVEMNPKKISFGEFTQASERVIDVLVKNNSSKTEYLLRSKFSNDFEVIFSDKKIEPGGQIVVRIQFNPRVKGKFSEVAELYFASMTVPMQLPITADVKYVNVNGNTPCPSFAERAADCCSQNFFFVEMYDAKTKAPIEGGIFKVEEEGFLHLKLKTNREGKVSNEARIGFYELIAEAKGYTSQRKVSYINAMNSRFVFYLEREEEQEQEQEREQEQEQEEELELEQEQELEPESVVLPESKFRPNNVVFLLDVSGSMGVGDKLELMQLSLEELVSVLRSIDRVALVSYANNAQVLVNTATGDQKRQVLEAVKQIKTGGKTSGAKGFKKSFQMLRKSLVAEGNNQLVVVTDGAFAVEDQKAIEKIVKQASRKGFKTTVVAIKANSYAKDYLGLVSQLGNGSFLQIEDLSSAKTILVEEVKKQSAK